MSAAAKSHDLATQAPGGDIELRVQCPQCCNLLGVLRATDFPAEFLLSCTACYFQMLKDDGIWRALPLKRASYFQKFMREYQTVREAEGRGSNNPQYYLELP